MSNILVNFDPDEDPLAELAAYAQMAKLMISHAIRDLTSGSKKNSKSAYDWLFDDSFSDSALLSFRLCCGNINAYLRCAGQDFEITPELIRNQLLSTDWNRMVLAFASSSPATQREYRVNLEIMMESFESL